uniref:Uncharacterized protein n=1 Tax=Peronospora matthiolae TaxID=2874970 RepID=A0AAV1VD98_9STRA
MGHVKADRRSRRTNDSNSSRRDKCGGNIVLTIGEGIRKHGKRRAKCKLTLAISSDRNEESEIWIQTVNTADISSTTRLYYKVCDTASTSATQLTVNLSNCRASVALY